MYTSVGIIRSNYNALFHNFFFCIMFSTHRLHVQQYFRIFVAGVNVHSAVRQRYHDVVWNIREYQVCIMSFRKSYSLHITRVRYTIIGEHQKLNDLIKKTHLKIVMLIL